MLTTVRVLAASGAWLELDGYCSDCHRLVSYGETQAGMCWWCQPETRPDDFEAHLEHKRKEGRARQQARQARFNDRGSSALSDVEADE